MEAGITGLSATADTVRLLVAGPEPAADPSIEVSGLDGAVVRRVPVERWHRAATRIRPVPSDYLYWAKPTIGGLQPGTRYVVTMVDGGGRRVATATVTTAPAGDSDRLSLAVGSCFDINGEHAGVLATAYDQLVAGRDLVYNLWLGDQVYVDAPWQEATRSTHARRIIFDRYLRSWGFTDTSGLGHAMRRSSNWYLPDDHEFWNGYPHPSWLTLFWHTAARMVRQLGRAAGQAPPHPAAQGPWGAVAGEAFTLFASPIDFDGFDESVSPDALQTIETDHAIVVMVDTRWHRTIRKSGPGAGFMAGADLERLTRILATDERLVCLALAKPLVGYLPHRGALRRKVEYGPEDYADQYTVLWRALAERRRRGRPTVIIGGDVHGHAVSTADDGGLLEVVSSPLSVLRELDHDAAIQKARRGWAGARRLATTTWGMAKSWLRRGEETLRPGIAAPSGTVSYPRFADDGTWEPQAAELVMAKIDDLSGMAIVDLDFGDGAPVVTVSHVFGAMADGEAVTSRKVNSFRWEGGHSGTAAWHKR